MILTIKDPAALLAIREHTLLLSGSAFVDWIGSSKWCALALAGIEQIDTSGLVASNGNK